MNNLNQLRRQLKKLANLLAAFINTIKLMVESQQFSEHKIFEYKLKINDLAVGINTELLTLTDLLNELGKSDDEVYTRYYTYIIDKLGEYQNAFFTFLDNKGKQSFTTKNFDLDDQLLDQVLKKIDREIRIQGVER